jgi:UrcA family protein
MQKSLLACALAFSSLSLVAHADETGGWDQGRATNGWAKVDFMDVYYSDLNLASRAGADVMLKRIKFAARQVCGGEPDLRELRERLYYKRCVRQASKDAIQKVNAPLLSAPFFEEEGITYDTAAR